MSLHKNVLPFQDHAGQVNVPAAKVALHMLPVLIVVVPRQELVTVLLRLALLVTTCTYRAKLVNSKDEMRENDSPGTFFFFQNNQ